MNSTVLDKCISVLDALSNASAPMTFMEIISATSLPKSTGHRILSVLTSANLIRFDRVSNVYFVGLKPLQWAASTWSNLDIGALAQLELQRLHSMLDDGVYATVMDGEEVVCVRCINSRHRISIVMRIGERAPLLCTAAGKAIAAFFPDPQREELLSRHSYEKRTAHTIDSRAAFEAELVKTRERGFALSIEEDESHVLAVSAPIFDFQGVAVAAIGAYAPAIRTTVDEVVAWGPVVMAAASRISSASRGTVGTPNR